MPCFEIKTLIVVTCSYNMTSETVVCNISSLTIAEDCFSEYIILPVVFPCNVFFLFFFHLRKIDKSEVHKLIYKFTIRKKKIWIQE